MSFKGDIPNYKSINSEEHYLNEVPREFWDEFNGIIIKAAGNSGKNLKSILDEFSIIIPCSTTTNWGYDFFVNDISDFISKIRKKADDGKIDILMDCLAAVVQKSSNNINVNYINEFLQEHNIGYVCQCESLTNKIIWCLREDIICITDDINSAKSGIKLISEQVFEHFEQALKQFESADNERARKDAVRDCASAMEAVIKSLANENDIKTATKKLRDHKQWGLDDIVKDGDAIFSKLHYLYPDLRHGSIETSDMTIADAEYWIGRITVYVNYMKRQKKNLESI